MEETGIAPTILSAGEVGKGKKRESCDGNLSRGHSTKKQAPVPGACSVFLRFFSGVGPGPCGAVRSLCRGDHAAVDAADRLDGGVDPEFPGVDAKVEMLGPEGFFLLEKVVVVHALFVDLSDALFQIFRRLVIDLHSPLHPRFHVCVDEYVQHGTWSFSTSQAPRPTITQGPFAAIFRTASRCAW